MPLTLLNPPTGSGDSGGGSSEPSYTIGGFSSVQNIGTVAENLQLAPGNIETRTGLILYNSSTDSKVYVKIGSDPLTNQDYSFPIPPESYWECPQPAIGSATIQVLGENSGIDLMVTELFKESSGS